jgi:hypothetical protein
MRSAVTAGTAPKGDWLERGIAIAIPPFERLVSPGVKTGRITVKKPTKKTARPEPPTPIECFKSRAKCCHGRKRTAKK